MPNAGTLCIAIIGGGASSVLILEALRSRLDNVNIKINVTVFERENYVGRGLAYRSKIKNLILNTPIDTMSICESNPGDFIEWLRDSSLSHFKAKGVPRGVYGDYLESRLARCIKNLESNGCAFRVCQCNVESIRIEDKYRVCFLGSSMLFDVCIIATGGNVLNPPKVNEQTRKRFLSIFDEDKIQKIKRESRVAILGAGQSAIDACIMMEQMGQEGNYTLISRSGVLPRVKSNIYSIAPSVSLSRVSFKDRPLSCLYSDVLETIRWKAKNFDSVGFLPASFRSMEIDLRRALKNMPSWQSSMLSITPYINELWAAISFEEKCHFYKSWQKILYHLRSAIMPESAQRFLDIYNSGRINMIWGDYDLVMKNDSFFCSTNNSVLHFDYVINASGIKAYSHVKLLSDEILNGKISINSQDGLCIDNKTMKVMPAGENTQENIYSLGYPTQGSVLISNSIELLRQSAVKIADSIITEFEEGMR